MKVDYIRAYSLDDMQQASLHSTTHADDGILS
jgi:hypothetical protein